MKKILALALITVSILIFQSIAFAAEKDVSAPVGHDISVEADEMKIVSIREEESPVVGEGIEIGEGEMKIVSFEEASNNEMEAPISGGGITAREGEARITAIEETATPVVGEEIAIGADEMKIISFTPDMAEKAGNNTVYYMAAGIVVLLLAGALTYRKLALR